MNTNPFHPDNLDPIGKAFTAIKKGDLPGHEFHGNQWTKEETGGTAPKPLNPYFPNLPDFHVEPGRNGSTFLVRRGGAEDGLPFWISKGEIEVEHNGEISFHARGSDDGNHIDTTLRASPQKVLTYTDDLSTDRRDFPGLSFSTTGKEEADGTPHSLSDPIYELGTGKQVGTYKDAVANLFAANGTGSDLDADIANGHQEPDWDAYYGD